MWGREIHRNENKNIYLWNEIMNGLILGLFFKFDQAVPETSQF